MRALVATGLALLVLAHPGPVYADPDAPQVSPHRGRGEDAQRLSEQLRDLDREPPPPLALTAVPSLQRTDVEPARDRSATVTHDKPLSQRWWFWVAVGAVAVAIGVTYEATRGPGPHLPGVTCDDAGCRP
jgi:hypothetical protein